VIAGRLVRLDCSLAIGVFGREWALEPVTVSEPQLSPFVGSLDVVVVGEALGI
jgi:hypothetical protein